jgi:hypothetical protein
MRSALSLAGSRLRIASAMAALTSSTRSIGNYRGGG